MSARWNTCATSSSHVRKPSRRRGHADEPDRGGDGPDRLELSRPTAYDFLAFAQSAAELGVADGDVVLRLRDREQRRLCDAVGLSVRFRFYTAGACAEDLSKIVFYSITFWLGLLPLAVQLAIGPSPRRSDGSCCGQLAYIALTAIRRAVPRLAIELPLLSPKIAVAQWVTSCVDWVLAGLVLYVLLPPGLPFGDERIPAAQLIGLVSHIPGSRRVRERPGPD